MPRIPTKQKDPPLDTEARVQAAVSDFRNKLCKSFRAAAKKWDVGKDVVRRRYNALTKSKKDSGEAVRLLKKGEELIVADWVRFRGMIARPADQTQIRTFAAQVSGKDPGQNWPERFLKRHKDRIKFKKAAPLDPKRATAFTREVAENNVAQLQDIINEWNIKPENMYNMDEKPLTLGGGRKHSGKKHAFAAEQKQCYRIQSDNLKMATVIETVCADGTASIPPGFVLPPGDGGDWEEVQGVGGLAFSPNGWTSDPIHFGWFKDDFVLHAKARLADPNDKILLIFDGHHSHKTDEMIDWAYENGILLYTLPPHTTHKLQPLDARVFAAVDRAWKERADRRTMEGQPITMSTLVKDYMDVRPQAMQSSLIQDAWRVTGLWPLTLSVFGPEDYAPSASTSRTTHLPASYPPLVPSSPVKLSDDYDYTDGETDTDYDPEGFDSESDSEKQPARPSSFNLDRSNILVDTAADPAGGGDEELSPTRARLCMEEEDEEEGVAAEDREDEREMVGGEAAELGGDTEDEEGRGGWCGTDDETERSGDETESVAPRLSNGTENAFGELDNGGNSPQSHPPRFARLNTTMKSTIPITTPYHTRSSSNALFSPATPFDSFLRTPASRKKAPVRSQRSRRELEQELQRLKAELEFTSANLTAANAHCTIMAMENADVREQLSREQAKKKRKGQGPKQALGVFLNPPAKKEARRRDQAEKAAKVAAAAEQERIQEAEKQARRQLRLHNAVHLTFDKPLASYRRSKKDDIQDLAAALALDQTGTIATIFGRIEEHVNAHPELEQNERFKGLFGASRRQPAPAMADVATASQPALTAPTIIASNPSPPPPAPSSTMFPSVSLPFDASLPAMPGRPNLLPPSAPNFSLPAPPIHLAPSSFPPPRARPPFNPPIPNLTGTMSNPSHPVFPPPSNAPPPSVQFNTTYYHLPNYPYSISGAGPSQWAPHR